MSKVSVIINTFNEEENLPRALSSAKLLADEIVVVDMKSDDKTVEIAKKGGAKVYQYKRVGYVEPARNFAISKATGDWIFILDADEEIPKTLVKRLRRLVKSGKGDYYRIPRKNIIFGKWMKHSRWWPDMNIRFFKKGKVTWNEVIHSVPLTKGKGVDLEAKEDLAIIHHNYQTITQYLERMNRYTTIQAKLLINEDYRFIWKDLIKKPLSEFLSRYFAGEGYKDGLHGLAVSLLQAFSEIVVYLKIWEKEKFLEQAITINEIANQIGEAEAETNWWLTEALIRTRGFLLSFPLRVKRKLISKNAKKT
jgi:(heptosyl)LPS beta-1,4-glucosyltransferase